MSSPACLTAGHRPLQYVVEAEEHPDGDYFEVREKGAGRERSSTGAGCSPSSLPNPQVFFLFTAMLSQALSDTLSPTLPQVMDWATVASDSNHGPR